MLISRRHLPLNALRCFEAAARHCHLRRAAEELGVTHGAVSRQVRILEQTLGVALFLRAHNRLQLTSAGTRLFHTVEDALDRISEGALYLDPDSMAGSLTIASTPSISVYWLVSLIGEFSHKYPEIDVRLVNIQPGQRQLPAEFDVAVCYGEPDEPRRVCRELYRERLFPVCSPKLLGSERAIETPRDLLALPLIHDRHGLWGRWFEAQQLPAASAPRNLTMQEAFQAILAAREGFGVALADRIEVARELREGSLVRLFDAAIDGPRATVLVADEQERQPLRTRVFIDHLQRALGLS
jgi:LysR family transcriptional regulator, glycine cleavage system transcriptional activator